MIAYGSLAYGADLGGDCCADLEERVAELEQTTVRKGNRKVSVTLYGHVNKAVMYWDDGDEENTYVVDNDHNSTRAGLKGEGSIGRGWFAGYRIELEFEGGSSSASVSQSSDEGGSSLGVRHSYMYLKSDKFGKLSWGLTSGATDDVTHKAFVAKNTNATRPDWHWSRSFILRDATGVFVGNAAADIGRLCGDAFDDDVCFDSTGRKDVVRYDTPSIAGFTVSASWGEDDFWDVALNWSAKAGDLRFAVAGGYRSVTDTSGFSHTGEEERWAGSAGILHMSSGLFVQGSYFKTDYDFDVALADGRTAIESEGWYVEGGVKRKWIALGETTIWGEYAKVDDGFLGACATSDYCATSSELTRWGLGVTQAIDAAALEFYLLYQQTEAELVADADEADFEKFKTLVAGGIIKF